MGNQLAGCRCCTLFDCLLDSDLETWLDTPPDDESLSGEASRIQDAKNGSRRYLVPEADGWYRVARGLQHEFNALSLLVRDAPGTESQSPLSTIGATIQLRSNDDVLASFDVERIIQRWRVGVTQVEGNRLTVSATIADETKSFEVFPGAIGLFSTFNEFTRFGVRLRWNQYGIFIESAELVTVNPWWDDVVSATNTTELFATPDRLRTTQQQFHRGVFLPWGVATHETMQVWVKPAVESGHMARLVGTRLRSPRTTLVGDGTTLATKFWGWRCNLADESVDNSPSQSTPRFEIASITMPDGKGVPPLPDAADNFEYNSNNGFPSAIPAAADAHLRAHLRASQRPAVAASYQRSHNDLVSREFHHPIYSDLASLNVFAIKLSDTRTVEPGVQGSYQATHWPDQEQFTLPLSGGGTASVSNPFYRLELSVECFAASELDMQVTATCDITYISATGTPEGGVIDQPESISHLADLSVLFDLAGLGITGLHLYNAATTRAPVWMEYGSRYTGLLQSSFGWILVRPRVVRVTWQKTVARWNGPPPVISFAAADLVTGPPLDVLHYLTSVDVTGPLHAEVKGRSVEHAGVVEVTGDRLARYHLSEFTTADFALTLKPADDAVGHPGEL